MPTPLAPHLRLTTPLRPGPAISAAAPEAPVAPTEAPVETPAPANPTNPGKESPSEPDIDEQIKRILREIPDPTPQPGGE